MLNLPLINDRDFGELASGIQPESAAAIHAEITMDEVKCSAGTGAGIAGAKTAEEQACAIVVERGSACCCYGELASVGKLLTQGGNMSSRFGAAFGAILALVLLALFAWSTLSWILQIVAADGGAIAKGTGYVYVLTTVAGLVSALVIAQLSVTKPGAAPSLGGLNPESTAGIYVTNTIVAVYLIVWILTGLSALIVGVMLYPENNKTISDLGTTWLGLAVSAAYAYFGISPAGSDKSAEDAKKKALSTATTAASSVGDQLKQKIDAGQIVFDPGKPELKEQLLKTNSGTQITAKLQSLVLELSKISPKPIRISDLVRTSGDSHHVAGRAVDIGNEDIAKDLLPLVVSKVAQLGIDEIIFDAAVAGEVDRNKWNYDAGSKHDFSPALLDQHKNHIHFSAVA